MKPQAPDSRPLEKGFSALACAWPASRAPQGLAEKTLRHCRAAADLDQLARHWPAAQVEPPAFRPPEDGGEEMLLELRYRALQHAWPTTKAPAGLADRSLRRLRPDRGARFFTLFGSMAAAAVVLLTAVRGFQEQPALHELWSAELRELPRVEQEDASWDALEDLAELDRIEGFEIGDERMQALSEELSNLREDFSRF